MSLVPTSPVCATPDQEAPATALRRRSFVGVVPGGATLGVASDLSLAGTAYAAVPPPPQIPESYDLDDLQTDSARPTANLITITVADQGRAHFAIPRAEVGQDITTAAAMIIADELDIAVNKVEVTLAPARMELVCNQLTGVSSTMVSMFTPIRVAAAIARNALLDAAAIELGSAVALLASKNGVVTAPDGSSITYGELAPKAASPTITKVDVTLKDTSEFSVVGGAGNRVDALAAVTDKKKLTLDLRVPHALPTTICRPPGLNGSPVKVSNLATVKAMPGVTHVAMVDTGVAVRGQIMAAVALVNKTKSEGRSITEADLDTIRNVCRCGAYSRIREAVKTGAARM